MEMEIEYIMKTASKSTHFLHTNDRVTEIAVPNKCLLSEK